MGIGINSEFLESNDDMSLNDIRIKNDQEFSQVLTWQLSDDLEESKKLLEEAYHHIPNTRNNYKIKNKIKKFLNI